MCLASNAGLCLLTKAKSEIKASISSCEFAMLFLLAGNKASWILEVLLTGYFGISKILSQELCFLPFLGITQTKQCSEQLQIVWRWKRLRTRCRKSNDEMAAQVRTNAQFTRGVDRNYIIVKCQKTNLQMDLYGSSFNSAPYL